MIKIYTLEKIKKLKDIFKAMKEELLVYFEEIAEGTDDEDIYYNVVDNKVTYELIYNNDGDEEQLKDTLGVKNPYRYKGYRYDNETGLYYLKSRYYNPELCRFISEMQ